MMEIVEDVLLDDVITTQLHSKQSSKSSALDLLDSQESLIQTANESQVASTTQPDYYDYLDSENIELEDIDYMIF